MEAPNMKTLGLILELNPPHFGHKYFIDKAKELVKPDLTIAVITTNFSMRGDVSVINKFDKASLCLELGIDIVVELPYIGAVASADYFCSNAINILNAFEVTDIAFGAELDKVSELRKLKDFFPNFKYFFNPTKFPIYQALLNDGVSFDEYNQEFEDAKVNETLSKTNPLLETENFIFGFSQVSFFVLKKSDILWVYEYNGNGLVFYDKHKIYGFTFYPTVDGNDHAIEALENEMPYLYYGIDFDYKTIMHTDFDNTVIYIEEERKRFLEDPEGYKERKEAEKKAREEEETRRLEEERARQMEAIMENHQEDETLPEDTPVETTEDALEEVLETEVEPEEEDKE